MKIDKKIVLGIDLGTTYSCVAYIDEAGKPVVIPNSSHERTTPSVVWFDDNHVIVGSEAKGMASVQPTEVASFVKRYMGDDSYFFECKKGKLRPEEVSSYILRKLVKDASEALGQEIRDVVITCPAYFFIKEREATKRAGEMAGLNVVQILNEPTAAAISYGITNSGDTTKNILVYDLGGGTFDVTMIQVQKGRIEVICTGGDHRLGGKNWDDAMTELLIRKFQDESGNFDDLLSIPEATQDLMLLSENLKKQLSSKSVATGRFTYGGGTYKLTVTREEFEAATEDLLGRTLEFTDSMLKDAAGKGVTRFDELLLVGGSSKMPQVARALTSKYGVTPRLFDPDEAVAKGAAIVGANSILREALENRVKELTHDDDFSLDVQGSNDQFALETAKKELQDEGYSIEAISSALTSVVNVASKTFGTLCVPCGEEENRLFNLIYRNTALPTTAVFPCETRFDNQTKVRFEVLENSEDAPRDELARKKLDQRGVDPSVGVEIWKDDLKLPPGLPMGSQLEVIFKMDKEGLLDVTCRHLETGRSIHNVIRTGAVLSREEEAQIRNRQDTLIVE
ncbi:MAG: Hsp70 family protein [Victivallales bacterium]|nr:Hsp70 family protein [Victivallales bacterium]